MLRLAIDQGVNYLDLGLPCDPEEHRELLAVVKPALENGYGGKIKVAVTLPASSLSSQSAFDRYLNAHMESRPTGKADFCLLGGLDRNTWPKLQEMDVLGWAERMLAAGKIDHLGFSFHDDFRFLRDILNAYDNWTFCQFQYSYLDIDHHPGFSGLKSAFDQGLAVVVSEPFKQGRLTKTAPEPVAKTWSGSSSGRSPAEWGLRWIWNHTEVSTAVVGISSMAQLKQNLVLADGAEPDVLTVQEEVLVSQVRDAYRKLRPLTCTTCRSCLPCPQAIDMPRIFELYNEAIMFSDAETPRRLFRLEGHCVENCDECGICARTCGRGINIPEQLKEANQVLSQRDA